MIPLIEEHLDEIAALCQEFGVARLEMCGSACTPEFDPARSDGDFLVSYPPGCDFGPRLGRLQDLEAALAEVLGRDVGLVMTSALNNRWFHREADKMRTDVYDTREVSDVA